MEEQLPLFTESIEERYQRILNRIAPHQEALARLNGEIEYLFSICPCTKLTKRIYNSSNGYCDYEEIWDQCDFCGKEYNKETKIHSWFKRRIKNEN